MRRPVAMNDVPWLGETAWSEGAYRFFELDGGPVDVGTHLDVCRSEDGAVERVMEASRGLVDVAEIARRLA